jgi:hypothetical protein
MPALVAGIHVLRLVPSKQDVDGRDKPGRDAPDVGDYGCGRIVTITNLSGLSSVPK